MHAAAVKHSVKRHTFCVDLDHYFRCKATDPHGKVILVLVKHVVKQFTSVLYVAELETLRLDYSRRRAVGERKGNEASLC